MASGIKKARILVITQVFSGGSWLCIERILKKLTKRNKILVLGLGKIFHKNKNFSFFALPYPRYDRWGFIPAYSPILSFLWSLPLFIFGFLLTIVYQPKIIIFNGLTSGLILSPFIKLFKKCSVVMLHSHVARNTPRIQQILKVLAQSVDLLVANSQGGAEDAALIIHPDKIVVNEHYADDFFFKGSLPKRGKKPFTIFYVGRLDKDKFCFPLIEIAGKLKNRPEFQLLFAGVGEYAATLKNLAKTSSNIKYLGYIASRVKLKKYYQTADLVWSFADETYLGIPAVEALACGTPVMIPEIPALGPTKINVKLSRKLLPKKIGWLVDPFSQEKILKQLVKIKEKGIKLKTRIACRQYAKAKYTSKNLKKTVGKIKELFD